MIRESDVRRIGEFVQQPNVLGSAWLATTCHEQNARNGCARFAGFAGFATMLCIFIPTEFLQMICRCLGARARFFSCSQVRRLIFFKYLTQIG
jgi:hypothetical protein